ncbi:hypothetical protein R6Q59_036023 [Mikania micrantha]
MGGTWLETRPSALVTESVDLNSGRPAVTGVASGGAIDLDGQRLLRQGLISLYRGWKGSFTKGAVDVRQQDQGE